LRRAVVIGSHHDTGGGRFLEHGIQLVRFQSQDGGHGTGALVAGLGHELAAQAHHRQAFVKTDGSRRAEGGVLAEGMPGHIVEDDARRADRFHGHHRNREDGGLGDVRPRELVFGAIEKDIGEVETQHGIGAIEHGLGWREGLGQLLAHPYVLGSLSGE